VSLSNRFKSPRRRVNPGHVAMAIAAIIVLTVATSLRSHRTPLGLGAQNSISPDLNLAKAYTPKSLPEVRAYALELVNRDRASHGLPPLVSSSLLEQAAQDHAQDMLKRDYFAHKSPEGKSPRDRFLRFGGSQSVGVGENIYFYQDLRVPGISKEIARMFQVGWMNSPGHRKNILTASYKGFGYGIVYGAGGRQYAVQMFSTE
jgi:uncharacterized protein YkwD